MARRLFYVDEIRGNRAELRGETAQHIRKVLRGERGQKYEVSDGTRLCLAEIADFGKDVVEFSVVEDLPARKTKVNIHLFASLIKFDHFEWLIEKATELGVAAITPIYSLRCEKGLDQAAAKRSERWRRIALETGQQSRRLAPPEIHGVTTLDNALKYETELKLWLEEESDAPPALRSSLLAKDLAILCGPEGGWDDRERQAAAETGWQPVSLGAQVLRAETAAIAAMAVIQAVNNAVVSE